MATGLPLEVWRRIQSAVSPGDTESFLPASQGGGGGLQRYTSLRNLLRTSVTGAGELPSPAATADKAAGGPSDVSGPAGAVETDLTSSTPFCRAHLAWVGGSLFASIKV